MDTDTLVRRLAEGGSPVRPRASPTSRALLWVAIASPFVAATALWHGFERDIAMVFAEPRFLAEQCAALATALAAATAAFATGTPGFPRAYRFLPLPALALWLFTLAAACSEDLADLGPAWFRMGVDAGCLPAMAAAGLAPAVVMLVMIRGAVPLAPRLTLFYAALAPAALVSFALQFFHHGDVTLMAVVWHFGLVWLVAPLMALLGRLVIRWPRSAPG